MIGLNLYTHHDASGYVNETVGVYVVHESVAAGVLRNSEGGTSAYLAWAPETKTVRFGPLRLSAGILIGAITGYSTCSVCPLVAPSVALGVSDAWRLRISRLPKPNQDGSGGWHFSIETGL